MANTCITEYKVIGSQKAVSSFWNTLQKLNVECENVYFDCLAEHFGIEYKKKGISVRGHIYWAEYEEDSEDNCSILSFNTESAWCSCDKFFEEVNKVLGDELSISWREEETGCEVFRVHDEACFFPEVCYVTASGDIFEDFEGEYRSVKEVIDLWCNKMNIPQKDMSEEEMMEFINDYDSYNSDDTYFYIYLFDFV